MKTRTSAGPMVAGSSTRGGIAAIVRAGVVAVVVSATLAASGTAAGAKSADRTVSADRWMRGICSAWVDYLDAVEAGSSIVPEPAEAVTVAMTSVEKDRRTAVRLQSEIVTAATGVLDAARVGNPDVEGGAELRENYLATVDDYRATDLELLRDIKKAPTTSALKYEAALTAAFEQSWEAWEIVGHNPLDELRTVPELTAVIDGTWDCQHVDAWFDLGYASDVVIGECWDEADETVACTVPHVGELFLQIDYPAVRGEPYPGSAAVEGFAREQCLAAFEGYVGRDYESSVYDFLYYAPDEAGWRANDREVLCFVVNADESPLTRSVRGSGA